MIGSKPNLYFVISWLVTCPLALVVILGASLFSLFSKAPKYEAWIPEMGSKLKTPYPAWAYGLIVILVLLAASCIPLTALCRKMNLCKPENWVRHQTSSSEKREPPDCTVTESTQPLTANV